MSTISAGTTSNTALKQTGDTTGTLVFQTNTSTTALTLNTSGAVGVGTSPSYGTAGQVLTSAGNAAPPTWSSAGSGSPGGSTTQVQYNNAGAFGGISGFTTDGTRVTASTTIGVGGATPSTSGSGVTFPATQSASTDANTLDDYEEGTWTPSVGGTATYDASNAGTYTKVGNMCLLNARLRISSIGTGSTTTVSGLPFTGKSTVTGNFSGSCAYFLSLATSQLYFVPVQSPGATTLSFYANTASSTTVNTAVAVIGNNTIIDFTVCYLTN